MGISEFVRATTSPTTKTRTASSLTYYLLAKRSLDLLVSVLALILLSPLFLIIAIAIKLDSSGPVIFRQQRVRGDQDPDEPHPERQLFAFYKFRSMYTDCDPSLHQRYVTEYISGKHSEINNGDAAKPLFKIKNDPRITRVGRWLRRTSLDELPQLINVIKGDMSLVGPRPALPYEVEQYSRRDIERLIPRAGLTGLWQVSGRTCLTFEEMIDLDVEYTRRRSLLLDLEILLKTIPAIFTADGAW